MLEQYDALVANVYYDLLSSGDNNLSTNKFAPFTSLFVGNGDYLLVNPDDYLSYKQLPAEYIATLNPVAYVASVNRTTRSINVISSPTNYTYTLSTMNPYREQSLPPVSLGATIFTTKKHKETKLTPIASLYSISDVNRQTNLIVSLNPISTGYSLSDIVLRYSRVFHCNVVSMVSTVEPTTYRYNHKIVANQPVAYQCIVNLATFTYENYIERGRFVKDSARNYTLYVDEAMDYWFDVSLAEYGISDVSNLEFFGKFAKHPTSHTKYDFIINKDELNKRLIIKIDRNTTVDLSGAFTFDIYSSRVSGVLSRLFGGKLIIQETVSR